MTCSPGTGRSSVGPDRRLRAHDEPVCSMSDIDERAVEHRARERAGDRRGARLIQPRSMSFRSQRGGRVGQAELVAGRIGRALVAGVGLGERPPERLQVIGARHRAGRPSCEARSRRRPAAARSTRWPRDRSAGRADHLRAPASAAGHPSDSGSERPTRRIRPPPGRRRSTPVDAASSWRSPARVAERPRPATQRRASARCVWR